MPAIVTDQFRILNASNFVESVSNANNSYYAFLGLPNPTVSGFGRSSTWNDENADITPYDNKQYLDFYKGTILFGKKITSQNVKRVIRKVSWTSNTSYDMYRHDYSRDNLSPNSNSARLYDSNYYVVNSDFRVYVCIDNGSSVDSPTGGKSKDEPTFTDLEPSVAGTSGDGYVWKYLFSVSPSDIIKFDSTEYVVVPNDWGTSTDPQIQNIRESADSDINLNQIKKVYIDNRGNGYANGEKECNILGDGSGAKVLVNVENSKIKSVKMISGGSGYTHGVVDLSPVTSGTPTTYAKLIPIIPPSKGHGYDIYSELGTDRVLVYARFDNSDSDFPTDTTFAQVGILKNPKVFSSNGSSNTSFTDNQFSSLYSIKLNVAEDETDIPTIGQKVTQNLTGSNVTNGVAKGYVASYDRNTKVLKYFKDRSLYINNTTNDETDNDTVTADSQVLDFSDLSADTTITVSDSNFSGTIDVAFGSSSPVSKDENNVNLGVSFSKGLANPEINRKTGDIIYIDNRTSVKRDPRQKEDVKIILEF